MHEKQNASKAAVNQREAILKICKDFPSSQLGQVSEDV